MHLLGILLSAFICSATEREHLYDTLDEISIEIANLSLEISTILAAKSKRIRILEIQRTKILQKIHEMNQKAMRDQQPSDYPTTSPSEQPTQTPTETPTEYPSQFPTFKPTKDPTVRPTQQPTLSPTIEWRPKKSIPQRKSARRNIKNVSANLDNELLAAAIRKHHVIKTDRIHLYDFDFPKGRSEKIERFGQELLSKPDTALILASTVDKASKKVLPFEHSLDSILTQATKALSSIITGIDNAFIQYSAFLREMFNILPLDEIIFNHVCDRMILLFPEIHFLVDGVFKEWIEGNISNPDAFNTKMCFAQFTLEEIVTQQLGRLEYMLNDTQYGISNCVPMNFRREIMDFISTKSIQKNVIRLFSIGRSEETTNRVIDDLQQSLFRLELMGISMNIAAIIYEWRQADTEMNHGTVAAFAGDCAWAKMIDNLLTNMGYNSSCVQRFRVTEIKKPRHASRRSRNKQQRYDYVFSATAFKPMEPYNAEVIDTEPYQILKKDTISILSMTESNLANVTNTVRMELNDDTNDVVIVAMYNVPIKTSEITGSAERHWVFTKLDITFHHSISMIYNVMKRINGTVYKNKEILITAVNTDIFHLTGLDKKIFDSILNSMNSSNAEVYNLFCGLVRMQYIEMKTGNKYQDMQMEIVLLTDQMVDIMLDFLENTVKMLLINKQFELNKFLSDSDYIQSCAVPLELGPKKTDLKLFFAVLHTLMNKLRTVDAGIKGVWSSFKTLQFDVIIRKVALTVGKILYDRRQSNCAGVVRIVSDPVITELIQVVINELESCVTKV